MEIDKKKEEEYKKTFFNKVSEIRENQAETINLMTKNAKNIGQSNMEIPNTGITFNNKIIEISKIFQNAGISMFPSTSSETSLLGNAIIEDLTDKLNQASNKLREYAQAMEATGKKKSEQVQALQNISPMRRFFSMLRAFFVPVQPIDFSLTEIEESTLNSSLQEYKNVNNEIWEYNLEDNIIDALVKQIAGSEEANGIDMPHRYNAFVVPGLLEESVIPDLKRLGLEHLVPRLQEALVEEYKKNLSEIEKEVLSDDNMYLYIPDFSRKSDEEQEEVKDSKEVADLESFKSIDSEVSAIERKNVTEVIRTELSQEKSKDDEKEQRNSPIEGDEEIGG